MKKTALCIMAMFALVACQPEIDVELKASDIQSVMEDGETVMTSFEATIEQKFTTIDDKKRAEVNAIAAVVEQYFPDAIVDVNYGDSEFEIEIEGELAVATGSRGVNTPWYIRVENLGDNRAYVSLANTGSHSAFAADLQDISFMARANDYLPMTFKLRAQGASIMLGGAIVEGEHASGLATMTLKEKRSTIAFGSDHWKNAPAAFVIGF